MNGDGSITLSWEDPYDDTVTGYQILRRRPTQKENGLKLTPRQGVELANLDLDETKELLGKFIEWKPHEWYEDIGEGTD